jgi:hypothetical protein
MQLLILCSYTTVDDVGMLLKAPLPSPVAIVEPTPEPPNSISFPPDSSSGAMGDITAAMDELPK